MSQTIASALDNEFVTFVDISDDFDCVICMQVADEPMRCSLSCAGIFCGGCMRQALARDASCPSCKKANITALKDVVLRNQIMKHQVYCINNSGSGSADEATKTSNNRKRKASSDEKCTWIGKYDELSTHMKQCGFEIVTCSNEGCQGNIERRELELHLQVCEYRMVMCDYCNAIIKAALVNDHVNQCPKVQVSCECEYKCTRDVLVEHQDKDCPMTEIQCEVVGCGAEIMRRDYEKHQDDAAKQHVRLLSTAYQELSAAVEQGLTAIVVAPSYQIKWRIKNIAAKLRKASFNKKNYYSPRFDVFFHGNHKFYIQADIQGNTLGIYVGKDVAISDDKNRLDIGGTSFSVTKAGLPDKKRTLKNERYAESPNWNKGWTSFLTNLRSYVDNDGINIIIDLKLNKVNEPLVLSDHDDDSDEDDDDDDDSDDDSDDDY